MSVTLALFLPGRLEFIRPLAGQLTLQRPPLLVGQIGDSDLQHYSPSTACHERPTPEVESPKTYGALYDSFLFRQPYFDQPDAKGYGS
jgi:hypothetical protein